MINPRLLGAWTGNKRDFSCAASAKAGVHLLDLLVRRRVFFALRSDFFRFAVALELRGMRECAVCILYLDIVGAMRMALGHFNFATGYC